MNGIWQDGKFVLESTINARITRLETQNKKMRDAMQFFCDRVDAGEVRSVFTYNQFKELLK